MLKMLFTSKTRLEILKLLFFNPANSYYTRQVATLTGQPFTGVRRELAKLSYAGLVETSRQGNRTYFKVAPRCPIFPEMRSMLLKCEGAVRVLREHLAHSHDIQMAFIYGSYARGQETLDSDIDVLVVGEITLKELSGLLSRAKMELSREINYAVFQSREFKQKIMTKDHFLTTVLKEHKIFLVGNDDELAAIAG